VAQLRERVVLNLTDHCPADAEFGSDFFERPRPPVRQAEAQPEQPPFAPSEGVKDDVKSIRRLLARSPATLRHVC
jgi:hypothetical protein